MEILNVDIKMENRSLTSNCLEVFVSWDMTPCTDKEVPMFFERLGAPYSESRRRRPQKK
jgi:hypothetical protein